MSTRLKTRLFVHAVAACGVVVLCGGVMPCRAGDSPALGRALGAAFAARAELCLLKGELNRGKVYLSAARMADPGACPLELKVLDMMYKDFPYVADHPFRDYRGGPVHFTRDGRHVVYTSRGQVVRVELGEGTRAAAPLPRLKMLIGVAISPSGRFVAAYDNMGNFGLCDMDQGRIVGDVSLRDDRPRALWGIRMDFSPEEDLIAAYYEESDEHAVYFVSTDDLSTVRTVPVDYRVRPLQFLSDGNLLIGKGRDSIEIVDPDDFSTVRRLAATSGWDAHYLPEQGLIAVGGSGVVKVIDVDAPENVREYQAASHNITTVRFLAEGRYVVYGSPKGESGVIDCATGETLQVFPFGRNAAVSAEHALLLADGRVIDLSACAPARVVMRSERGPSRPRRPLEPEDMPADVRKALEESAGERRSGSNSLVWRSRHSADETVTAWGTRDGRTVVSWRSAAPEPRVVTSCYWTPIDFIFVSDNKNLLRLAQTNNGMAGAIELYSLSGELRSTLRLDDPPRSAAVEENLGIVVFVDEKNRVLMTTIPELDRAVELLPPVHPERQVAIGPSGGRLVVTTGDTAKAFDLTKVAPDRQLPTYEAAVAQYGISLEESEPLWPLLVARAMAPSADVAPMVEDDSGADEEMGGDKAVDVPPPPMDVPSPPMDGGAAPIPKRQTEPRHCIEITICEEKTDEGIVFALERVKNLHGHPGARLGRLYRGPDGFFGDYVVTLYDRQDRVMERYAARSGRFILWDNFSPDAKVPGGVIESDSGTFSVTVPAERGIHRVAVEDRTIDRKTGRRREGKETDLGVISHLIKPENDDP